MRAVLARRTIAMAVVSLTSAALLVACSTSTPEEPVGLPDDAVVNYAFLDSSVPPQYHRSITLTVTRDDAHIVIDSYGDVLADEHAPTPAAVWQTLGSTLPSVQGLTVIDAGQGCTGGTGIDLTVVAGAETLVALSPQFCAGSNDALEAPIRAWIAPARDLFPATDVLAPEGE
jgi:hypothetical protein